MSNRFGSVVLLSVWVLLQPPLEDGQVLTGAPLGDWVVNGRFPTQEQCAQTKANSQAALAFGISKDGGGNARPSGAILLSSRCIELDELKKMLRTKSTDDDDLD